MIPFIVGVGRSGTTLLRLMLDSHPDLAIPPETHFFPELLQEQNIGQSKFIEILVSSPTWGDFGLQEDEFRSYIKELPSFSLPLGLRAFYALYAKKFSKRLFGDKTPNYFSHMEDIQRILPDARFIHLIRAGRDVALSFRGLWFGPGNDIKSAARFWSERITIARNQAPRLSHYHEVRYEDLITDTVGTLSRICKFLDLQFSERMLDYHSNSVERLSEFGDRYNEDGSIRVRREDLISIFSRTQLPPDQSRIARWKREMTQAEQAEFEIVAGLLLHKLGYETKYDNGAA